MGSDRGGEGRVNVTRELKLFWNKKNNNNGLVGSGGGGGGGGGGG